MDCRIWQNFAATLPKALIKKPCLSPAKSWPTGKSARRKINSQIQCLQSLSNALGTVSIPLIAGFLFFKGQMSLGGVIASGYFASSIFPVLENIAGSYSYLNSTKSLRQRLAACRKARKMTICSRSTGWPKSRSNKSP